MRPGGGQGHSEPEHLEPEFGLPEARTLAEEETGQDGMGVDLGPSFSGPGTGGKGKETEKIDRPKTILSLPGT